MSRNNKEAKWGVYAGIDQKNVLHHHTQKSSEETITKPYRIQHHTK
ncbi:MAG: hypothetical protein WC916_00950 [Candidatus Woesearchaeota archaeon]